MNKILITNNQKFIDYSDFEIQIEYRDESYLQVLERVRDYVHKNYKILTHPLYSNLIPTSTVYRSILIEKGEVLDFESVLLIENSISKVERILKTQNKKYISAEVLEDLKYIDYEIIEETLRQIF